MSNLVTDNDTCDVIIALNFSVMNTEKYALVESNSSLVESR